MIYLCIILLGLLSSEWGCLFTWCVYRQSDLLSPVLLGWANHAFNLFLWGAFSFTSLHHPVTSLSLLQCQLPVLQTNEEDAQSSPKENFANSFAKMLKQRWACPSHFAEEFWEDWPVLLCAPKDECIFPALQLDQKPSLCCYTPFSKESGKTLNFSCTSCGCGALLSTCRRLTVSMEKPSINIEAYQHFTAL